MKNLKLIKLENNDDIPYDEKSDIGMGLLDDLISQIQPKEIINGDKKEKKKKDKKKKKRKNKSKNSDSLFDKYGFKNLFEEDKDEKKPNNTKIQKVDKSSDEFYEYRFSSSLILLKDLLKDINHLTDDSKKTLQQFKANRQRGSFTAITNQTSNIATLYGTKLNVIKEITNVNRAISDLEIKSNAKTGKDGENNVDNITAIEQIYDKLMEDKDLSVKSQLEGNVGKKKKKKKKDASPDEIAMSKTLFEEDEEPLLNIGESEEYYEDMNEYDGEDIDDVINNLISDGKIEFTDNEIAFKYENKDIKIVIDKNVDTGRWDFRAIDSSDDTVYDYPLPSKKSVGKVKFDMDKGIAKDQLGNIYELRFNRS